MSQKEEVGLGSTSRTNLLQMYVHQTFLPSAIHPSQHSSPLKFCSTSYSLGEDGTLNISC